MRKFIRKGTEKEGGGGGGAQAGDNHARWPIGPEKKGQLDAFWGFRTRKLKVGMAGEKQKSRGKRRGRK